MKKLIFATLLVTALVSGARTASATFGKCCATINGTTSTGGNIAASCCAEPDTASGSVCAAGQTEIDCSTSSACPTSSASGTTCAASDVSTASPAGAAAAPTTPQVPIIIPKLSISIPTISMPDFAKVTQSGDYIYIPFISQYLVGAYKMGVGIASILAIIMIMAGGLVWIAAAGDSGKIGKAKTMISGAVVGLVLTLGSYVALQTVNPNLVNFTALKIKVVSTQTIDVIDDYNPEVDSGAGGGGSSLPPSQLDPIFAKYAPCAGVTPDTLKAIAQAESGLNPSKVNGSGYTGLFQTKAANCPSSVKSYCTDLTNPDNNTAAGAAMIKSSVATISANCPNATAHDQMVMIYVGHNMGGGMLKYVTKNACDLPSMKQAAITYYVNNPDTAKKYATKYQPDCLNSDPNGATSDQAMADCTAGPKFDYAVKTADKSGVSQVLSTSGGSCPY